MDEENHSEGKSLFETPTWAVATVITGMVIIGTIVNRSLEQIKTWFASTRRKALLSALEKIKEELMLFGLLSLLMCHWTIWISKICVKSSSLSSRFFPCTVEAYETTPRPHKLLQISNFQSLNHSVFMKVENVQETHLSTHELCPEGHEPFASYESLEQLHRLLFVLGVIHVTYNFVTIVLAMVKIHSWKTWESQALSMANEGLKGTGKRSFKRLSTFVFHHTSHPWSKDRVLVWLLCFSRQFWSSINRADYMALRLGFLTNHELHPSYDFHNYMLRSLDDEFRDIVGISVPLWVYAIFCIFINFHGTYAYFWLSFTPAILILLVGTKLHHIVVKLALEVEDSNPCSGNQFNLRDELFWFGKPKLLLWLIQLISFQNAFEMATFIWSLWEIRGPSCFMENRLFLVIRLISGITFQFWCSFITFPLYVIVTQMGSKFKKSVVSENIRESLKEWQNRAKNLKQNQEKAILSTETSCASTESTKDEVDRRNGHPSSSIPTSSIKPVILTEGENCEISPDDPEVSHSSGLTRDSSESSDEDDKSRKDEYSFLPL